MLSHTVAFPWVFLLLQRSMCVKEDECFLRESFLHLPSASPARMLLSFLHIFQVTVLFWGLSLVAVLEPCLCFQDVLGIKEEKALLPNWEVFEGTFMYPTGTCKPSFQIKSSKISNLISGGKMFMSYS